MSRRRFGALRRLASGRWQARYTGPDGGMYAAPATFRTKTEADRWLSSVEREILRGTWLDPGLGRVALSDYATRWLEHHPGLRPRTRELYEGLLRIHVLPALGAVEIGRLTPGMVREWHAGLVAAKPAATTPAKAYRLLHAILATAASDEVILRNPCLVKGAAVERSAERTPPTVAQVFDLASALPARFRVMVLVAAFGGLRWGELVALKRHRIDLLHGTVVVAEQYLELDGGRLLLGPPKSDAGRRTVALPAPIVDDLRLHVDTFVAPGRDALVFCGAKGAVLTRRNFSVTWRVATRSAGTLGVRFHDLRHLAATLAATVPGTTTRDLMTRLGHSSPRAALRYQHAAADRDAAIAAHLGGLLAARTPTAEADVVALRPPSG